MQTKNNTYGLNATRLSSDIFSPISISFYSITFIFIFLPETKINHVTDYIILILLLVASPLLITKQIIRLTGSTDIDIANRRKRVTVYKYAIAPIFIGFLYSKLFVDIHLLYIFSIVALINIILSLLLNFFIKLSVHVMSLSSVISLFVFYYHYHANETPVEFLIFGLILTFSVLPLVAFSRLKLGVHSIPELLTGLSIGIINTFVIVYFMQ